MSSACQSHNYPTVSRSTTKCEAEALFLCGSSQVLCPEQINVVFNALEMSRILYTLSTPCARLTTVHISRILKRTFKFGFCKELLHVSGMLERSASRLFTRIQNLNYQPLPPGRLLRMTLCVGDIIALCLSAETFCIKMFVSWCL